MQTSDPLINPARPGVYWADMDNISVRVGRTVLAAEATPVWDTLANPYRYRRAAIVVYPQALSPGGDPYKRTFWTIPCWRCSVGTCSDAATDDVGFLEKMFELLPSRMSVDPGRVRGDPGCRRAGRDQGHAQ